MATGTRAIRVIAGLGLMCLAGAGFGFVGQPAAPAAAANATVEIETRVAELIRAGDAAGLAAALDSADQASLERAVAALLSAPTNGITADPLVVRSLAARLTDANGGARGQILRALARTSRREAVAAVIGALEQISTLNDSDAVFRTLVAQTGRADIGADADAWRRWWAGIEWIPEAEWLRRVAAWQAERAAELENRLARADRRLGDLARAQYSLTPDADRPAFLLALLGDELGVLRGIGLELATRAVLDARPLPDGLFDLAATILSDARAGNRARAARLIAAAGVDRFGVRLAEAVERERDPDAAAAILDALAISANPGSISRVAAGWLERSAVAPSAARAILRVIDAGGSLEPESLARADAVLRHDAGVSLGSAGVALFGRIAADDADFLRLGSLLLHDDAGIRNAAAASLASRAIGIEPLLRASSLNNSYFMPAARAIAAFEPIASGWRRLSAIEGVPDDALRAVAEALPDAEILLAAEAEPIPARVLMLLEGLDLQAGDANPAAAPTKPGRSAVLRVRAIFELGRDAETIADAERWPGNAWRDEIGFDPAAAARLCLGRFEHPAERKPTAAEWLAALERTLRTDSNACRAMLDFLKDNIPADISEAQRERIEEISRRLPALGPVGSRETPDPDRTLRADR